MYEKISANSARKLEVICAQCLLVEISCFPQMVGAIEGSHVLIINTAPKNDPNNYYKAKQVYCIVLQGVADTGGRFIV